MPNPYEYAVLRIVPRVEREEFINAGVLLYCRAARFLHVRTHLAVERLRALGPLPDPAALQAELDFYAAVCAGSNETGALAALNQAERFRWLASPRDTMIQLSATHAGLREDPQTALDDLFMRLVWPPE